METSQPGFVATRRRRWHICVPALCLALACTACRGKHEKVIIEDDDSAAQPLSAFKMSDRAAARQLVGGFYSLEGNSWRWTARDFVISFRTPPGATKRGANVSVNLMVPEIVTQKLGAVRLAAAIKGKQLGSERYAAPGNFTFAAEVPAELCSPLETVVDFHLDKTLPPSPGDTRDLGVIATGAALTAR